jgi:hypothetical protein
MSSITKIERNDRVNGSKRKYEMLQKKVELNKLRAQILYDVLTKGDRFDVPTYDVMINKLSGIIHKDITKIGPRNLKQFNAILKFLEVMSPKDFELNEIKNNIKVALGGKSFPEEELL